MFAFPSVGAWERGYARDSAQHFHLVPRLTAWAKKQFGNETRASLMSHLWPVNCLRVPWRLFTHLLFEFGRLGRDRAKEESYRVSGVRRPCQKTCVFHLTACKTAGDMPSCKLSCCMKYEGILYLMHTSTQVLCTCCRLLISSSGNHIRRYLFADIMLALF